MKMCLLLSLFIVVLLSMFVFVIIILGKVIDFVGNFVVGVEVKIEGICCVVMIDENGVY